MQIHVAKPSPKWWNCFSPKSNGKPWRIHTFNLILDQWQVLRIIGMRFAAFVNERCIFSRRGTFLCFVNIWKTRSVHCKDESVEAFGGSHQSFISNFAEMLPFRLALLQTRERWWRNGTVPISVLWFTFSRERLTVYQLNIKQKKNNCLVSDSDGGGGN